MYLLYSHSTGKNELVANSSRLPLLYYVHMSVADNTCRFGAVLDFNLSNVFIDIFYDIRENIFL